MAWSTILLYILIIYVILSVALYFFQDYFFFKPEKLPKDFSFQYEDLKFDEYILEMENGAVINGIHFKSEKPKGVVFYLKGNSRSIKGWGKFAIDFVRNNYDVIMIDYRGFGKSIGKRTHEAIKGDLQKVYDEIKKRVPERFIILYGRSMGSGFATKLASVNKPKMLILDAPYYSLKHVAMRYLPFMPLSWIIKFPVPTYKWIKYVQCPIHIIHGTDDKLIPLKSGIMLSQINPDHSKLHIVINGGHNNLHNFPSYHVFLDDILAGEDEDKFDISKSSLYFKRKNKA